MRNEGEQLYVVAVVKRIVVSTLRAPFFAAEREVAHGPKNE